MYFPAKPISQLFDPLFSTWEKENIHRKISSALVLFFLLSVILIELKRNMLLPEPLGSLLPDNHFHAVHYAFTVVLILEVIGLIFSLPSSFSLSVGKQFQILSLILLRNAFKELSQIPEPIVLSGTEPAIRHILTDGFGALLIFALLGYYYHLLRQMRSTEEKMSEESLFRFVAAKKGIALILLIMFFGMGTSTIVSLLTGREGSDFFHDFYTLLILTDILLVLIAQCFNPSFIAVFRNSGFALTTLLIRIALAAPPMFSVLFGIAAAVFAILLVKISHTSTLFRGGNRSEVSEKD